MSEKEELFKRTRKRLLDELKCSPEDVGIWHIAGEDPNCDFGGAHGNPTLAYVEGKLEDAIDYALELPRFFGWGYGGRIWKINVMKLDAQIQTRIKKLQEKRKQLTKELEDTKTALKSAGIEVTDY